MKQLCHAQLKRGFTLIETLVAITILLVAIVGPMTIAAKGLQTAFYAREEITAFFLAQEGVELMRARRDEDAIRGRNWLQGIPNECESGSIGCGAHVRNTTIRLCTHPSLNNCRLNFDEPPPTNKRGFYTYTAGSLSPYTRRIWVRPIVADQEAEVEVQVSWQSGLFGVKKTVTVKSRIFNHYDDL